MLHICTHIRAHVNICTRIKIVSTSFQQFLASRVLARLSEVRTGTEVVRGLVNSPCNRSGIIVVDQSSISLFLSLSLSLFLVLFLSVAISFRTRLSISYVVLFLSGNAENRRKEKWLEPFRYVRNDASNTVDVSLDWFRDSSIF